MASRFPPRHLRLTLEGKRFRMDEVPLTQQPLLALDSCNALALQHKEILFGRVRVVKAARLARIEHGEFDAEVLEAPRLDVRAARLEQAASAERLVRDPGSVSDVDCEPAR